MPIVEQMVENTIFVAVLATEVNEHWAKQALDAGASSAPGAAPDPAKKKARRSEVRSDAEQVQLLDTLVDAVADNIYMELLVDERRSVSIELLIENCCRFFKLITVLLQFLPI